jgi:hypothetical protein
MLLCTDILSISGTCNFLGKIQETNEKHKYFQTTASADDRDRVRFGGLPDGNCRSDFCEGV